MYGLKMNDKNFESKSQMHSKSAFLASGDFSRVRVFCLLCCYLRRNKGITLGLYGEKLPRVEGLPAYLS